VETISDLNDASQICASSLLVRSKSSQSKTFLRKWKADSWRKLPFGRIAKPFLGNHSKIELIFLSLPTHANHFQPQENVEEQKTLGISGLTSSTGYYEQDLFASLQKTLKVTFRWDSPQSSAIWKKRVIGWRQAYSARLKSALRIRESGSSSWPTVTATEARQGFQDRTRGMKGQQESLTTVVFKSGLADQGKLNTSGSRQESWATPNTMDYMEPRPTEAMKRMLDHGQRKNRKWSSNVREQVVWDQKYAQAWATPQSMDAKGAEGRMIREGNASDLPSQTEVEDTGTWNRNNGKLNPRWVETLMGLPVGWVMPSCVDPITPQGEESPSQGGDNWMTPEAQNSTGFQTDKQGKVWPRLGSQVVQANWPTASTMDVITPTRDLLTMESKGHWGKQPRQRPDGIGFIAPNTGKLSEMIHYTSPVTTEPTNSDSSEMELFHQPQNSHSELSGRN
jgi:hypothetical protein